MAHYSLDEYASMVEECHNAGQKAYWQMGELMIALTNDWGDKAVNNMANLLRVSPSSLRKKRQVAVVFPADRREIDLPWSMYEAVSHVPDADRQLALLTSAHDEQWTTDKLRQTAREKRTPPDTQTELDKFVTRTITAFLHIGEAHGEATMLSALRQVNEGVQGSAEAHRGTGDKAAS